MISNPLYGKIKKWQPNHQPDFCCVAASFSFGLADGWWPPELSAKLHRRSAVPPFGAATWRPAEISMDPNEQCSKPSIVPLYWIRTIPKILASLIPYNHHQLELWTLLKYFWRRGKSQPLVHTPNTPSEGVWIHIGHACMSVYMCIHIYIYIHDYTYVCVRIYRYDIYLHVHI